MPRCFVIQPFDCAEFDKRYDDVLEPSIRELGFEAYRVDKDRTVTSIITAIENGIRGAEVCVADISTDNPNVWLELGYARALGRPVIMICSRNHRDKLPFDIQDHAVIFYDSHSPRDFEKLKSEIRERIKARTPQSNLQDDVKNDLPQHSDSPFHLTQKQILLISIIIAMPSGQNHRIDLESLREVAKKKGLSEFDINFELDSLHRREILAFEQECAEFEPGTANYLVYITNFGYQCVTKNRDWFSAPGPTATVHATTITVPE